MSIKKISKRDVIITAFVFLICIAFCYSFKGKEEQTKINERDVMVNYAVIQDLAEYMGNPVITAHEISKNAQSLQAFHDFYDKANAALTKGDHKEYNLNMTKVCLLQSLYLYTIYVDDRGNTVVDHTLYEQRHEQMEDLFTAVGLDVEDYYFFVSGAMRGDSDLIWEFPGTVLRASLYHEQYVKGLPPLSSASFDSASSLLHIFEVLFPYFLVIISCIVCLDMLVNDRKCGTLKLLLTQPRKRSVYLIGKVKKYFKKIVLMTFLPVVMVFLLFGAYDGFKTLSSPVLAYEEGITSLQSIDNHIKEIRTIYDRDKKIYFGNVRINPDNPADMEPQAELELIPFWGLLLLSAIFVFVLIWFYVALNLLMHVLIGNPLLAATCFLLVSGIGIYLSMPENACTIYNAMNPYTYRNPVYAMTGYIGYSFLFSVMVLLLYSLFINGISIFIFKRKDVS